jgi:hypothetical protein
MLPFWVSRDGVALSVEVDDGLVFLSSHPDGAPSVRHVLLAEEIQELVRALVIARRVAYGSYWA